MVAELLNNEASQASFPAKNILAKAAAMLASGSDMNDVGTYTKDYLRKIDRKFRATKKQISGNVIRVDHYGNLITNIEEEVFNMLRKERQYLIQFGREKIEKINHSYNELDDGDCTVIFNDLRLLEIGINKGNASKLLGLKYDSPVSILFDDPDI
jgi:S-adenosylmethionine hydrolase